MPEAGSVASQTDPLPICSRGWLRLLGAGLVLLFFVGCAAFIRGEASDSAYARGMQATMGLYSQIERLGGEAQVFEWARDGAESVSARLQEEGLRDGFGHPWRVRVAEDRSWVALFSRGRDEWADRLVMGRPLGHGGHVYGEGRVFHLHSWRVVEALCSSRELRFEELRQLAPFES